MKVACMHGCGKFYVKNCDSLRHHERTCDSNPNAARIGRGTPQQFYRRTGGQQMAQRMTQVETAHGGNFRLYRKSIDSNKNVIDKLRHVIMNDCRGVIRNEPQNIKFYVTGKFVFEKATRPGVVTDPPVFFKTSPIATTRSIPIEEALESTFQDMREKINTYIRNGSGWVLKAVLDVDLRVATYDPLRATSYLRLPEKLHNSVSVLNIRNYDDDKCALWCILARLYPIHRNNDRNNLSSNPNAYRAHENDIDTSGIEFPLQIRDIGKLERRNDLSINVFSLTSRDEVVPIRISEKTDLPNDRIVDLLYITNGFQSHYCLITNLAGLCRPQITTDHNTRFICRRCLRFCSTEKSFESHMEKCSKFPEQKRAYPKKNDEKGRDKVRFTKVKRQHPLPFYFVADFESRMEKVDTCAHDSEKTGTTLLSTHIPCGAMYMAYCTDPRYYHEPKLITPETCGGDKSVAEVFLDEILEHAKQLREMLKYITPISWTDEEKSIFYDTTREHTCHICKDVINSEDINDKVPDHDHLSGRYRGPAHKQCNLDYGFNPEKVQIPCFFHNLKHYDAHLLISAAKKRHGEIKVIPNNTEKYISFTIGDVVFKDSLAFTQASLDELVGNLSTEKLESMRRWLQHHAPNSNADATLHSDSDGSDGQPTESDMEVVNDRPDDDDDDDQLIDVCTAAEETFCC